MFTYKIIKLEDTPGDILYGIFETTEGDDGQVLVMGQAPINGVFYESIDELTEHIAELNTYVQSVASGAEQAISEDDVTWIEMDEDGCGEGCGCCDQGECECEDSSCETKEKGCGCGGNCGCGSDCACGNKGGFRSLDEESIDESVMKQK